MILEENSADFTHEHEQEAEHVEPKNKRLFTQEEVNNIIRNRLNERKKEQDRVEYNEKKFQKREQELAEKEDALNKRIELYERTEFLKRNNYPESLLELVTLNEGEKFEDKVRAIVKVVDATKHHRRTYDYVAEPDGNTTGDFPAIGTKHEPRYSNIR